MSVDYQHSLLWRGEDPTKQKFKPKYDGTKKVFRYFPGQAPKFAGPEASDDEEEPQQSQATSSRPRKEPPRGEGFSRHGKTGRAGGAPRKEQLKPTAVVEDAAIGRLRRLQAQASGGDVGHAERLMRHRTIHEARVLEAAEEDGKVLDGEMPLEDEDDEDEKEDIQDILKKEAKEEDSDMDGPPPLAEVKAKVLKKEEDEEDEVALRRERARELALLRRKDEEIALLKEEEEADVPEEEDEDESESDEESSEDGDPKRGVMMKPVFVSRSQRDTIHEREALQREEEEAEERRKEKEKERKVESKTMLIDEVRREEEAEQNGANDNDASDMELIDDDDEKNEAEEYEKWKIRELKRIKRDKEERLSREKELEMIERRRMMTDEEREADDKRLDAGAHLKQEAKSFAFMQKYYHRGGFFQDKAREGEEPLYLRDYHEPTAEEKFDKNLLPKAMQLRRGEFGKKGQVKHSHLTEVDTTDMTAAWSQHNKQTQRYQERMAGAKGIMNFDRPGLRSSGSAG